MKQTPGAPKFHRMLSHDKPYKRVQLRTNHGECAHDRGLNPGLISGVGQDVIGSVAMARSGSGTQMVFLFDRSVGLVPLGNGCGAADGALAPYNNAGC